MEVAPLDFAEPKTLARNLEGASTLFNTYWIRFPFRGVDFDRAVSNSKALFDAARTAQVPRIVQISITGASEALDLPYFRGKGLVEQSLIASGLSYAILRPALIYGPEDILLNNIAWLLRRFPLFMIPGAGEYRVQPVFVEDLARLAVEGSDRRDNYIIDAVGQETYTFNGLVESVKRAVNSRAIIIHVPPVAVRMIAGIIGRITGDITLTRRRDQRLDGGLTRLRAIALLPLIGSAYGSIKMPPNSVGITLRKWHAAANHYKGLVAAAATASASTRATRREAVTAAVKTAARRSKD